MKRRLAAVMVALSLGGVAACGEDEAERDANQAIEEAEDAGQDALEEGEDAAREAGEAAGDTAGEAGDAAEDAIDGIEQETEGE